MASRIAFCQRVQHDAVRRRQRETRVAKDIAAAPADTAPRDRLCAELDAELYRLAKAYRAPLIHCYLQGQTRDQAAAALGLAVRTLDRRILRGREILRKRLERHGLTLSAALLILALSQRSTAGALPAALLAATVRAAAKISAGASLAPGEVSLQTLDLVHWGLKSLALTKLRIAAVFFAAAVTTSAAALAFRGAAHPGDQHKAEGLPVSTRQAPPSDHNAAPKRTDLFGDPLPPGAIARLGSVRWRLQGKLADVMAVTEDGKELVTADRDTGVACWDMANGSVRRRLPADPALRRLCLPAQAIAVSPEGRLAGLADAKGIIHVLDLREAKEMQTFPDCPAGIQELVFSGNSLLLAARARDGIISLWDVRTRREQRRIGPLPPRPSRHPQDDPFPRGELALSRDGKMLAWVGNEAGRAVHLYDTGKGAELYSLGKYKGHRFITFSPDGRKLASLSDESPGQVWEVDTGKEILPLPQGRFSSPVAAFSPDSKALAVKVPFDSIFLVELPSGRRRWKLESRTANTNRQEVLAFTPDGGALLVNAWDPVLYRYDTASGRRLLQPGEQDGCFRELAFSQDGQSLYTLCEGQHYARGRRRLARRLVGPRLPSFTARSPPTAGWPPWPARATCTSMRRRPGRSAGVQRKDILIVFPTTANCWRSRRATIWWCAKPRPARNGCASEAHRLLHTEACFRRMVGSCL